MVGDFEETLKSVGENDLVFLDPPYPAGPENSSFQDYHQSGFSLDQQRTLAELAVELDSIGAYVMITNEPSEEITDIYDEVGMGNFQRYNLEGKRMISSTFDERTDIGDTDIMLTNYERSNKIDIFTPRIIRSILLVGNKLNHRLTLPRHIYQSRIEQIVRDSADSAGPKSGNELSYFRLRIRSKR